MTDRASAASGAFDPAALLQTLDAHGVAFVVIGGVAAILQGAPLTTGDLDICYERSTPNLEALGRALRSLDARLRGVEAGLPFQLDARTLRLGDSFTFATSAGDLDCLGTPSGTGGYADLVTKAIEMELVGIRVRLASVDDLIRMKRAANRLKDREQLRVLGALRDELDGEEP